MNVSPHHILIPLAASALLLVQAFAATLTITLPNGGESWQAGSSQLIAWNTTGTLPNVKLEYTINNGLSWAVIVANTPNTSNYNWTLPQIGTWRARIRITSIEDPAVKDMSDSKFSINLVVWPISGTTTPDLLASQFGSRMLSGAYDFHRGLDAPNSLNTPVHPLQAGIVARFEDTSQTLGTSRERFGNWILIQHRNVSGVPRHTTYLHLNAFNGFQVGDTVSTTDVIGFMGRSGVGINTIHTHFELYKNLSGTLIDADKAFNAMELLSYADSNRYGFDTVQRNDSNATVVTIPSTELDLVRFTLYGSLVTKIIDFNTRQGIDPLNNDSPRYNGVFIEPQSFTRDSLTLLYKFWVKNSETGQIDSVRIQDAKGYSRSFFSGALPVQISSFAATQIGLNSIRLNWQTLSEINNYGFYIQRRTSSGGQFGDVAGSFIAGHGTTNQPQSYMFTDNTSGIPLLWYRLRQIDLDGSIHFSEPIQISVTSVGGKEIVPGEFMLLQNYPNPFNPSTEIEFSVATSGKATLVVYNTVGQRIATLFDDVAEAGQYYNVKFNAKSVASGVYIYRLQSGRNRAERKLLLLK